MWGWLVRQWRTNLWFWLILAWYTGSNFFSGLIALVDPPNPRISTQAEWTLTVVFAAGFLVTGRRADRIYRAGRAKRQEER
jgi:hypothetical protein